MNETGKNKYAKEFKVPDGFDEVLRNLTREILRNQPENINKFGKCFYFTLLCYFHYISILLYNISIALEYFTNEVQARGIGSDGSGHSADKS